MSEYDRLRPPKQQWYELKTPDFGNEYKRNDFHMKATKEVKDYIENLKDGELC